MTPHPVHRLPAPLEAAIQRLKLAAREAAERTIESLGLAALAANNAFQRDGLLGAQFELNRKSAVFALTFNEAFDQRVLREISPRSPDDPSVRVGGVAAPTPLPSGSAAAGWASFSLVEDKEVEAQISADRFGMEIAHACEWELRELDAYVSSLLSEAGGERDRNPLRPDLVGFAMIRGITAVSDRDDVRKVLSTELSRSLGSLLRAAYSDIVAGLRNAGVQPLSLAVRNRAARRAAAGDAGAESGFSTPDGEVPSRYAPSGGGPYAGQGGSDNPHGSRRSGPGSFAPSQRGPGPAHLGVGGGRHSGSMGQIDPGLMSLIRRLTHSDGGGSGGSGGSGGAGGTAHGAYDDHHDRHDHHGYGEGAPLPPNLIRTHREELRQAASGAVDHMVIDLIGFMFDQILADPNVPPQLARQIARLQLPVLRAALGDKTFFSLHRHPVRRFINRIATLGSAFEDFGDEGARLFLTKVRELVQEVAEGDFERIDLYEQKLAALEAFTQKLAHDNDQGQREAASLLSEREDQQRLRDLYSQRLAGELKELDAPAFLRDFLSNVWSQVLLRAAAQSGPEGSNSPQAQRLRNVGRELFLSVQPKSTAAQRKVFLTELPRLMQELTEGMNLIAWPEAQRRAFFGQLMPAHAEALKASGTRTPLDINLMARQVEGALQRPLPSKADLAAAPLPQARMAVPQLTAEEAQRVGLVQESAIDWTRSVDIDLSGNTRAGVLQPDQDQPLPALPGLPESTEAPEATEGQALADVVQMGYPYQMHIDGEWQKVRLSHVSAQRSFFIFTHGTKQRKTISLTQRMLTKLCETGRLKAFEASYLVERATARARRQLASMSTA